MDDAVPPPEDLESRLAAFIKAHSAYIDHLNCIEPESRYLFSPGDKVRLVDLAGNGADLNGAEGTIVHFIPSKCRFSVSIGSRPKIFAVRAANLERLETNKQNKRTFEEAVVALFFPPGTRYTGMCNTRLSNRTPLYKYDEVAFHIVTTMIPLRYHSNSGECWFLSGGIYR